MVRKILFLLVIAIFASCGPGRQTASRTSKPVYRKTAPATKKPVTRTHKPVTQKPVAQRGGNTASSGNSSAANPKTETLEAVTRVKVTTEMVLSYIDQYKGIAQNNMSQYGIPASIILAQGILESGAGTGPLSASANNHFGIKCHKEWTGESVRHDDDAEQECFRKYSDPSESYRDHSLFLTGRSRYAGLFALDKGDYAAWAKGLRAAGYATDPRYPEKLIGLIERYQLDKYDAQVLGKEYVPVASNTQIAMADNADYYKVNPGDTLYSISKKFNLTVDELKRLNSLQDNALSIGQNLKVK